MKRRGHITFTLLFTAIAIYAIDRMYFDLPSLIVALGVGEAILASAIPDILEPGGSTSHRKGSHSWRVLGASLIVCGVGLYLLPQDVAYWHAIFFLPWGYATHLLADALTPAGLPF